jgi:uncharacterized membrane protein YtjA (UPF0391 family)
MLHRSSIFLFLAVMAALLGFSGLVTGALIGISKMFFLFFILLWGVTRLNRQKTI